MPKYDALVRKYTDISTLNSCQALLGWDQNCLLPEKAADHRANQSAIIAKIAHQWMTNASTLELLKEAWQEVQTLDKSDEKFVNVSLMKKEIERAAFVSEELVIEIAKTEARAHETWKKAKSESNYGSFEPDLRKLISLKIEKAKSIDSVKKPYDTLIDEYEPETSSDEIRVLFDQLREGLIPLIQNIGKAANHPEDPKEVLGEHFPKKNQQNLSRWVAQLLEFDLTRGRMDESVHPFSESIGPHDNRITTTYDEKDFQGALYATVHEVGHGLYEQGLKNDHWGVPLGNAVSFGIHESQSLFWENRLGRSRGFSNVLFEALQKEFGGNFKAENSLDYYRTINRVKPSLVRVHADEVTYSMHIIIRFEIEQAIINDGLDPKEIPKLWNDKYEKYLGVTPPNDAKGCLQDVHWSCGAFGYFPSYALGHMYASQFTEKMEQDLGLLEDFAERKEFSPLLSWLRKNIHSRGSHLNPKELVQQVTGKPLSPQAFLSYLNKKYQDIYNLT